MKYTKYGEYQSFHTHKVSKIKKNRNNIVENLKMLFLLQTNNIIG